MVSVVNGDEYEYQLMEDLLRRYDPRIRPSINSSEPLNVTFGLALAQIIDVVSIHDIHTRGGGVAGHGDYESRGPIP